MSRLTIIDGNTNDKNNVRTYMVKGEKGDEIASVVKTGTSGLVDTYTITMTSGKTYTFTVTNGNGVDSVEKTSTVGLVDTYTMTFDNGDTTTFTVTNGKDGSVVGFEWGGITGDIEDQTDLITILNGLDGDITSLETNKANNKMTWTTTLDTTWTGASAPYTKTVSLTNMLSTYVPVIDVIYSNTTSTAIKEAEEFAKISKIESGAGEITLTCFEEKPTVSLNVRIEVVF